MLTGLSVAEKTVLAPLAPVVKTAQGVSRVAVLKCDGCRVERLAGPEDLYAVAKAGKNVRIKCACGGTLCLDAAATAKAAIDLAVR